MPAATAPDAHIDMTYLLNTSWIKAAQNCCSILVFPGKVITDDAQVALNFLTKSSRTGGRLIVLSAIGPDDQIALFTGKQVLHSSCSTPLT